MENGQLNWIANFIWGIADDVLRDVYVRGKYRDVILPMTVIRRLDACLEATKQDVLKMSEQLDKAGVANKVGALSKAAGPDANHAFYNDSPFTLRDLQARAKQQQLKADFEAYLDGFSPNVQEILDKFKFRNQISTLIDADALGPLIEKFLDPDINLSPHPVRDAGGSIRLPGLDNHAMGTIFEELIRRFNEENNEEAGEHFTPRDVVRLMANLIFWPIADHIQSATYRVYDGACGTGGMLTVAEDTLRDLANSRGKDVSIHLFGQEVNPETYAISKADLLLKGEGAGAENMKFGSTLSRDAFPSGEFDFMLSNPPYGKSWKMDLERMGGKKDMSDHRFIVQHDGDELSLITRSSDGQLLFLVNKLTKMVDPTGKSPLGSRIAEVHNGSSLFTGDAGSGESNIRRWIIENDWLEAIIALPLNMFYNTGIATYIWVLTNAKPENRKGKVQLIDATQIYQPLRKNMGAKNSELSEEQIKRICEMFLAFEETEQSKIFSNEAFGYWKIRVERPLRLHSQLTRRAIRSLRYASGDEDIRQALHEEFGDAIFDNFSSVRKQVEKTLRDWGGNSDEDSGVDEDSDTPRRKAIPEKKRKKLLKPDTWKRDKKLYDAARALRAEVGEGLFTDHNRFRDAVADALEKGGIKLSAAEQKSILNAVSWRVEDAPPVIKKVHKLGKAEVDPLHGLYANPVGDPGLVLEYEPDSELRDSEQVPLLEEGGIEAFFSREVLPHVPDAWIDGTATKLGYEISFTRHFYKPPELRPLDEIKADLLKLQEEGEGLLEEIVGGQKA
ncbi:type I restriction enzyme M protein [Desulfosalsimonas propionicica]|uniref:site-specific DNA-methyltransferase (adenine-specific) n=1 Tax=Desulfosalsimonas propionicica TaxID=332175 RepID=A0A7W0HJL7_9BACT|nr:class I SAM-dependent DNA methyltransferase [Desulfosalsimonas propionicica]MBA2880191.1 type I restriction enzyme M protein [Desulfosalsimonas propionicica]